uniref:Uncharacterized protein n=1 Tax=Magallana gigas TaxID=29159 RepID=A0A8W8NA25_MAGGI
MRESFNIKDFGMAKVVYRDIKGSGKRKINIECRLSPKFIQNKRFPLCRGPTEKHPDPIPAAGTSLDILRAQKRKRRVLVRVNSGNVLGPEEKKIKNDAFCLDVGANMEIAAEEAEETVVTCTSAHDEDVECVPVIKEMKDIPNTLMNSSDHCTDSSDVRQELRAF